ncbi:MAG: hypothetical protein K6G31_12255 [Paludibacteraceae bacterium]|nr:hypothetical protein [Paludibacteraceae bacterium]MCR5570029.1 hypothetical protein [Paludibacteraceae bacterium]
MNIKHAGLSFLAFFLEIGTYIALYTLLAGLCYEAPTPEEASAMRYTWYAFILTAIVCNSFNQLLYLQILIWGIIIKFMYNTSFPWLCLAILGIGVAAIVVNIILRLHLKKKFKKVDSK